MRHIRRDYCILYSETRGCPQDLARNSHIANYFGIGGRLCYSVLGLRQPITMESALWGVVTAARQQVAMMCSTTAGHDGGHHGHAVALSPPLRGAVALSSLCYSGVGLAYGRVNDPTGQSLFLAVGVFSAVADADLLEGTSLERLAGPAHTVDRWFATAGGVYFLAPRVKRLFSNLEAGASVMCLLLSTACLHTARKQRSGERWAAWQIAWHVLSAGTMVVAISLK